MTAKRLDHRALFVALAVLALVPTAGRAQYDGKVWRLPAGSAAGAAAGSRGVQQTRQQPQVIMVQPVTVPRRTVFPQRSTILPQTTIVPQQAAIIWVPAVVLADGRVFANFGYGFEQVFRSCASTRTSGGVVVGQPGVIAGNGAVLSPPAPTYTQPVPNQQTASQQMAAANLGVAPAYTTCFSQNAAGGVIVYRF